MSRFTRSTGAGSAAELPLCRDQNIGQREVNDPAGARAPLATGDAAPRSQQCSGGASLTFAMQQPASLGAGPSHAGDGRGLAAAGPAGRCQDQGAELSLADAYRGNKPCCSRDTDASDAQLMLTRRQGEVSLQERPNSEPNSFLSRFSRTFDKSKGLGFRQQPLHQEGRDARLEQRDHSRCRPRPRSFDQVAQRILQGAHLQMRTPPPPPPALFPAEGRLPAAPAQQGTGRKARSRHCGTPARTRRVSPSTAPSSSATSSRSSSSPEDVGYRRARQCERRRSPSPPSRSGSGRSYARRRHACQRRERRRCSDAGSDAAPSRASRSRRARSRGVSGQPSVQVQQSLQHGGAPRQVTYALVSQATRHQVQQQLPYQNAENKRAMPAAMARSVAPSYQTLGDVHQAQVHGGQSEQCGHAYAQARAFAHPAGGGTDVGERRGFPAGAPREPRLGRRGDAAANAAPVG